MFKLLRKYGIIKPKWHDRPLHEQYRIRKVINVSNGYTYYRLERHTNYNIMGFWQSQADTILTCNKGLEKVWAENFGIEIPEEITDTIGER